MMWEPRNYHCWSDPGFASMAMACPCHFWNRLSLLSAMCKSWQLQLEQRISCCSSWKLFVLKHVLQGSSFLKVAHYFLNFNHFVLTCQRSNRPRSGCVQSWWLPGPLPISFLALHSSWTEPTAQTEASPTFWHIPRFEMYWPRYNSWAPVLQMGFLWPPTKPGSLHLPHHSQRRALPIVWSAPSLVFFPSDLICFNCLL